MKLDNLEEVTTLKNDREKAIGLRTAARCGRVGDFYIWDQGAKFNVWSVISEEPVRSAIIVACEEFIIATDKRLRQLGVVVSDPIEESPATIDDWKRCAEMYSRAWLRELGGKLLPKRHFIDALVLTTRHLRERAEAAIETAADAS